MTRKQKQALTAIILSLAIVGIDQAIKVAVKTGMCLRESIHIADWFQILFTENNGMAFGMEVFDKWFLTSFRILAVIALVWYICRVVRQGAKWGYLICLTMIAAGAAGNIFDCLFYGMVFSPSTESVVSTIVPWGSGYSELMLGKVVDMFYFPLLHWHMPDWVPIWGSQDCIFFSPIFNFADASISCGVVALILFYNQKVLR